MKPGSLVVCVKGHPNVITEGVIYTVAEVYMHKSTGLVAVRLCEVSPPPRYGGFLADRFVEIQGPVDIDSLMKELLTEKLTH